MPAGTKTTRVTLTALCALLALTLAAPAPAATKAKRHRCHLAGTNLVHSKLIKVVKTKDRRGLERLRGCSLPRGRVVTIDSAPDMGALGSSSVSLDQVAGRWVMSTAEGRDCCSGSSDVSVTDVRTGRSYVIHHSEDSDDTTGSAPSAVFHKAVLDTRGRTALADGIVTGVVAGVPVTTEEIVAFAPDGTALVLDSGPSATIPSASLTFVAGVIGWTHGGVARSVRFR